MRANHFREALWSSCKKVACIAYDPCFDQGTGEKLSLLKEYSVILITSFYDINQEILRKNGYFQNFR